MLHGMRHRALHLRRRNVRQNRVEFRASLKTHVALFVDAILQRGVPTLRVQRRARLPVFAHNLAHDKAQRLHGFVFPVTHAHLLYGFQQQQLEKLEIFFRRLTLVMFRGIRFSVKKLLRAFFPLYIQDKRTLRQLVCVLVHHPPSPGMFKIRNVRCRRRRSFALPTFHTALNHTTMVDVLLRCRQVFRQFGPMHS